MKANDIRKQFKAIGYRISFKTNPFKSELKKIEFPDFGVLNGNIFPKEAYETHKKAMELRNSFSGLILESGDKIV